MIRHACRGEGRRRTASSFTRPPMALEESKWQRRRRPPGRAEGSGRHDRPAMIRLRVSASGVAAQADQAGRRSSPTAAEGRLAASPRPVAGPWLVVELEVVRDPCQDERRRLARGVSSRRRRELHGGAGFLLNLAPAALVPLMIWYLLQPGPRHCTRENTAELLPHLRSLACLYLPICKLRHVSGLQHAAPPLR